MREVLPDTHPAQSESLTLKNRSDFLGELNKRYRFRQISVSTKSQAALPLIWHVMGGDEYHGQASARSNFTVPNLFEHLYSTFQRHFNVQQDQVKFNLCEASRRLLTIRHEDARMPQLLQQSGEKSSIDRVVVSNENFEF